LILKVVGRAHSRRAFLARAKSPSVQVLCRIGRAVVVAPAHLNIDCRQLLNPDPTRQGGRFALAFCPGHKVIAGLQTIRKEVFNGDVARSGKPIRDAGCSELC